MERNKKKIIRACTVSNSIGFFKEIIVKLKNEGYEPIVVTSPGKYMDEFKQECPEFKTIELPMERHISIWKDGVALLKMIWLFMKERPYVIHSITPKAGLLCMVAGWLTRVPVRIHTFTGLVWPTATGTQRKILMTTDKILCACATHINPEGVGVMNDLKNGGITTKPMKVLGYGNVMGVDMERFDPKRFEMHKDPAKFVFTFVGRIVGDKGINELVEAFTLLHDKYPQTVLRLVGRYEKNLDPVSELTMKRIDANPAIEANGPIYGDDLLQAYVDSDCHVMPSYREGFPNTVLEAGALGLPQIVTDINGSREIVSISTPLPHKEEVFDNDKHLNSQIKICDNGIIVPSKDAKALYDAMECMLTNEVLREKIRNNARPMIESRFEKCFVQGCLMEYYKSIM